jgi:hypothetical protein
VERYFPSVSWFVGNIIEKISALPEMSIECLLMAIKFIWFMLVA